MERTMNLWGIIRSYIKDVTGTIAVLFGVMAPLLIGVAGMSLDYSQAYLVKQRLAQALDAAALAATASSTNQAEIEQKVREFFDANYPEEKLGVTFEPSVQLIGDEVIVSGTAQYHTLFLGILGIDTLDVDGSTTVLREVQGIEVVMVLDNTGSMSTNNNIQALRNAASNFIYILYGIDVEDGQSADPDNLDSMVTRDPDYIKIGLVPYSTSVNVGPYGLGEDTNGDYYGASFVNNPHNIPYSTNQWGYDWLGCVLADDSPNDTLDHEGPWDMYRYCRDEDDDPYCHGYWHYGTYYPYRKPNEICPRAHVVPLTSSPTELKHMINYMEARGHTYGNYGMVWGGRVLSEDYPFEEGHDWDNQYWRKAIVMMTDGQNTMHPYYSAYGPTQDHNLNAGSLNNKFIDVCDDLKAKGAIIYTVTFYSNVPESTKDYYRQCATGEDYYHDAPNQEDLIDVFETISRELSNLHIVD